MPVTLYLIRHGETEWNLAGRWQGHADVPLNELGLEQARLIARRLAAEGVRLDAIYSSDLARAYQTAWEIGAAVNVAVQLLPALREIDLGLWSGLKYDEIKTRFPEEAAQMEAGRDIPRGGGESIAMLRHRVVEALDAIIAHHSGEALALVTHGGCIRALLSHADGETEGDSWKRFPHIGNTSISTVAVHGQTWRILEVNDMAHLEATHDPELISTPPDDTEQPQSL